MSRRIKKEMRDNQKEEKKDFKKEHNKKKQSVITLTVVK